MEQDAEEFLTIEEATAILKRHRIKGLTNRESVRRALQDKRIPSTRVDAPGAPYRISSAAINAIVASQPAIDAAAPSVHRLLFDHYAEDPLNNPITAVRAGVIKDADEAARLFRLFSKHQKDVAALDAKKAQAQWEAEQTKKSAEEAPCEKCGRHYFAARQDSGRLVAAVTDRSLSYLGNGVHFANTEKESLEEFKSWFCRGCGMWRFDGVPAAAMRRKIGLPDK